MAIPAPGAPTGPSKASPAGGQQAPKKYYAQTMTPLGVSTADVGTPSISGMTGQPWTPPGGGGDPTGGGALETVSSALTDAAAQAQAPAITGTEDWMKLAGDEGFEALAGQYGGGYFDPIKTEMGQLKEQDIEGEFGQSLQRDLAEVESQKAKAMRDVRSAAIMSGSGFGRIADVTGERARFAGIRADTRMQSDANLKDALKERDDRLLTLGGEQETANTKRETELQGYGTAHIAKYSGAWGEGTIPNPLMVEDIAKLSQILVHAGVGTDVADAMIGDLVEHWAQSGLAGYKSVSGGVHYPDLHTGSNSYVKQWAGVKGGLRPGDDITFSMLGGAAHLTEHDKDWWRPSTWGSEEAYETKSGVYTETGEPIMW